MDATKALERGDPKVKKLWPSSELLQALEREDPKDDGTSTPRRKKEQWRPFPRAGPEGDVLRRLGPSSMQLACDKRMQKKEGPASMLGAGDKTAGSEDLVAARKTAEALERADPKDEGATKTKAAEKKIEELLDVLRARGMDELCQAIAMRAEAGNLR